MLVPFDTECLMFTVGLDLCCFLQVSSLAVTPFFVENVSELQLNSLKLVTSVSIICLVWFFEENDSYK